MKQKKWLPATIGIIISVVLLFLAFRNLQPQQVWANIKQANPALLILGAIWYFAAVTVITLRWQFLLNAIRRVPLKSLLPLVCIGYAGNNVYPFRSGELLRIILLQRKQQVPYARGTTTVVIERVFDGLVMLTFILVALLISDVPSTEVRMVAMVAAPIFLTGLVIFFVLAARPNTLRRLFELLSRLLPGKLHSLVAGLVEDVISGLAGLRTPANLLGAIVSSYATWSLEASVYWIVAMAFNLEANYVTMLLVVGVVNLAGLIPASPGQFGVFETFASAVLVAAGVAPVQALAYAVTVHMVIWLPVTLVGLLLLLQQGLNFSALTHAQQMEQKALS